MTKLLLVAAVGVVGCTTDTGQLSTEVRDGFSESAVQWHPAWGIGTAAIPGTDAVIDRHRDQIRFYGHTNSLPPGDVVSIHVYVFNHPENCTHPSTLLGTHCSSADADVPEVEASVIRLGGIVVGGDGVLDWENEVELNDPSVCYAGMPCHNGIQFTDSGTFVCMRDHGAAIPGQLDAQLNEFQGGCTTNTCKYIQMVPKLAPQI